MVHAWRNGKGDEMRITAPEIPSEQFEIFANGLDHPECLAFDRTGRLWAGGEAGQIYSISDQREVQLVTDMGGFCGGVAWSPDDSELFVCNPKHGVVRVTRSGNWSVFACGTNGNRMICPNYGVFDRSGSYYVTDSGQWQRANGYLLRFDARGHGEIVAGPFGFANGLALSEDEETLYMVESDSDRIWRICTASGKSEVFAEAVGRMPDGLALDAGGELFASCYASDDIHRIGAEGQVNLYAWDRWAILLSRPTNIAFHEGYLYAANLGRTTITRAKVGRAGKLLANQR